MPKLLIIDDVASISKYYAEIGRQLSFEVETVNDSMQALGRYLSYRPDAVILDLIMPGKNGFEVLSEIMSADNPAAVIIISGYGDSCLRFATLETELLAQKPIATLRKPVRRDELTATLELALRSRGLSVKPEHTDGILAEVAPIR